MSVVLICWNTISLSRLHTRREKSRRRRTEKGKKDKKKKKILDEEMKRTSTGYTSNPHKCICPLLERHYIAFSPFVCMQNRGGQEGKETYVHGAMRMSFKDSAQDHERRSPSMAFDLQFCSENKKKTAEKEDLSCVVTFPHHFPTNRPYPR